MKLIVLPIAFLSLSVMASADVLRDQITSMGSRVSKALVKKDSAAIARILRSVAAVNFVYKETGAKPMNFDQMMAKVKLGMARFTTMTSSDISLESLKVVGTTATAFTLNKFAGKGLGPDNKPHELTLTTASTDTYQQQAGQWKLTTRYTIATSYLIDGKTLRSFRSH